MDADRRWACATWEGAAEESLLAGARLTMAERLAWLQEMRRLADHVEARRQAREESGDRDHPPPRPFDFAQGDKAARFEMKSRK